MRIAMDYQIFCLQAYGGISRYFVRLAEQFSKSSHDVKIFSPLHCNEYLQGVDEGLVEGRRIAKSASKLMRPTILYNNFVANRKIEKWHPDVVHETYYSVFDKRGRNIPAVVTVYDMVHELFPSEFSKFGNISMRKRKAVERADHVICISESTRQDLIRLFAVDPGKISVVHLGFDNFVTGSPSTTILSPARRPYLLFVGNRGGYKNFSGFLRAFAASSRLKDEFDIIAFGGGGFSQTEKDMISGLAIHAQQVKQMGGSDVTLGELYRNASVFVYPSLYEGFGLPPLEALANGCPVALSNTSSMPEVVGEAGAYFDPASVENISTVIEELAFSPSLAQTLTGIGQERLKRFSWSNCADDTLAVYSKLVR